MSYADVLAQDVLSYVEQYHPDRLEEVEGQAGSLAHTINTILEVDPPGWRLSLQYRQQFLATFADAYVDMLGGTR